jgi:molybdopterin-guanine dinucleotide biosynthesis protein A
MTDHGLTHQVNQVLGLVLAGGQGRRMGGADKSLLPLGGRPLLAHVLARLAPQCAAVAISANGDLGRFAPFGIPVLPDADPSFAGPLAGILAGLDAAEAQGFSSVASVPVDTPFLPRDLVARLRNACETTHDVLAISASGGQRHPAVGLWPVALAADLRGALAAGQLRVGAFADRHRAAVVCWPDLPRDPFFNINTPADLATAEALAKSGQGA